jgi:hypothetical protein
MASFEAVYWRIVDKQDSLYFLQQSEVTLGGFYCNIDLRLSKKSKFAFSLNLSIVKSNSYKAQNWCFRVFRQSLWKHKIFGPSERWNLW